MAETSCDISIMFYPFETQQCSLVFASAHNSIEEVYFTDLNKPRGADDDHFPMSALKSYDEDESWNMIGYTVATGTIPGAHFNRCKFEYKFFLARKCTFYMISLVIPVILLALTSCLVFIIPHRYAVIVILRNEKKTKLD